MWQTKIILSKSKQKDIEYTTKVIDNNKFFIWSIVESDNLVVFYLAIEDKYIAKAKAIIYELMIKLILINYKYSYISDKLKLSNLNLSVVSLISAVIFYDYDFEENKLCKILDEMYEYCLDGIINFRLTNFRLEWKELINLTNSLLDNSEETEDLINITSYMLKLKSTKKISVLVANEKPIILTNLTDGKILTEVDLYDTEDYTVISTLIAHNPTEIILEKGSVSEEISCAIKSMFVVKEV